MSADLVRWIVVRKRNGLAVLHNVRDDQSTSGSGGFHTACGHEFRYGRKAYAIVVAYTVAAPVGSGAPLCSECFEELV